MSLPGSVQPSAPVTVNGASSMDDELKDFAAYVKSKYPNTLTTALPRPYVDDVVHPAASEDFGINDEVVAGTGGGVTVIVPLDAKTAEKDLIMLIWGKQQVAGGTITKSEVGKYKSFKVAGKDIPEGVSTLCYEVYKSVGSSNPRSPEVSTLFRKGQPGVNGTQGVGVALPAPIIGKPASNVVGPAEAKAGIKVTIPAYLSMNEHDVIYLYWGNEEIPYTVKKAELNKPIEILVPEAIIQAAGDSTALPVYYYVEDLVGNESEWSANGFVEVKLTATSLNAPHVLDDQGAVITTGTIDFTSIQLAHVLLQFPGQFNVGDSILLHWVGTTQQGQSTAQDFGPLVVADPTKPQQIPVPFSEWSQLGGGNARFSYTLTPKSGSPSTSKVGYMDVTGVASLLPPPEINKTADDWVDADLKIINVLIPKGANLQDSDQVTLYWNGTRSDGSVLSLPVKTIPVSQNMAGTQIAVRLDGATFLKVLEGGHVDITYEVKRGARVFKSEQATYEIGEPAVTLPAPTTEIALVNNVLDPDKDEYEFNMVIEIPQGAVQPTPCTIYLHWETSQGDYYSDELQVAANSKGPHSFTVARPVYEPKGSSPVQCTVYYAIEWPGKPIPASADLVFNVATAAMQNQFNGAPVVPAAVNGKIYLAPIINNVFPVRVDLAGLAIGDEVVIKVGGYSTGKYILSTSGAQDFNLPLHQVLANNMQSVIDPANYPLEVQYELVRNGTAQVNLSNILKVQIEGALTVERFETVTPQSLKLGVPLECLALRVVLEAHGGSIVTCRAPAWYPTWGNILSTAPNAKVKFELRGLARRITFDMADDHALVPAGQRHCVIFYTASGAEIGRINHISFGNKPAGCTQYSTRVHYVSPSAAIKSFTFHDGGTNVHIDNISYEPF